MYINILNIPDISGFAHVEQYVTNAAGKCIASIADSSGIGTELLNPNSSQQVVICVPNFLEQQRCFTAAGDISVLRTWCL